MTWLSRSALVRLILEPFTESRTVKNVESTPNAPPFHSGGVCPDFYGISRDVADTVDTDSSQSVGQSGNHIPGNSLHISGWHNPRGNGIKVFGRVPDRTQRAFSVARQKTRRDEETYQQEYYIELKTFQFGMSETDESAL